MARHEVTQEAQAEMERMFHDGHTYRQIADHLGLTIDDVSNILCSLGISRSRIRMKYREVYDMSLEGKSVKEIASETGFSRDSIATIRAKQQVRRKMGSS